MAKDPAPRGFAGHVDNRAKIVAISAIQLNLLHSRAEKASGTGGTASYASPNQKCDVLCDGLRGLSALCVSKNGPQECIAPLAPDGPSLRKALTQDCDGFVFVAMNDLCVLRVSRDTLHEPPIDEPKAPIASTRVSPLSFDVTAFGMVCAAFVGIVPVPDADSVLERLFLTQRTRRSIHRKGHKAIAFESGLRVGRSHSGARWGFGSREHDLLKRKDRQDREDRRKDAAFFELAPRGLRVVPVPEA
jgi:hypothetical protein